MIVPGEQQVPSDFSVTYYDNGLRQYITASEVSAVTNYTYEEDIQTKKRNIFLLKQLYVPTVLDDVDNIMEYRKGSTQYVSETLKRADNIRLYE